LTSLLQALASETNDGADGDARAIRVAARIVEAYVVELRTYGKVRKYADIDAATHAIGEVGIGPAAGAYREMPGTREELDKGSELSRVVHNDARAEQERVSVEGNAARGGVVAAEVTDDTQVGDGFVGDRTADAVLVEVRAAAEVKVGIADGGVEIGLGARRNREEEQSQAEHEQAFHRNRSFQV